MYRVFYNNTLIADSRIEDLAIINPVVSLKVNCAGTFTFTMPYNHPYYDLIQKKVGLIKVFRDDEQIFEGDCVRTTVDFFKQKKIECEGDLAFLNDTFLRPGRVEDLTSRQLLERYIASHNALVSEEKRFTVGQVTAHDSNDSISCYTNYNSTMTEIKEDLIDDIGGFLRVRHENNIRYLDYLASSPRTNSQIIRLGENLIDLSIGLDTEELATVIIPLGETLGTQSIPGLDERLTIKTAAADSMHPAGTDYVYSQAAVSSFGWIEKVVEWNDVTDVSNLLSKGKKYLQETQFENLVIKAKAIDDRIGCAILISILKEEAEYDFYATFTVQEELGVRGARVAAYSVEPQFCICLEATTAADIHGVSNEYTVCKLGKGPAVSFMDRATLYDRELYDVALNSGIPCQPKSAVTGGNNSGAIHLSKGGVRTMAISVPCRYIHSPSGIADLNDAENAKELTKYMINKICSGEIK